MQFKAFRFSTPSFENINVLPLGGKSSEKKISPEHSPGRSLVQSTTRIAEFFVVGKMSGILVGFVIMVGHFNDFFRL